VQQLEFVEKGKEGLPLRSFRLFDPEIIIRGPCSPVIISGIVADIVSVVVSLLTVIISVEHVSKCQ